LRDLAALRSCRLDLREREANSDEKRCADESGYQRLPDRCGPPSRTTELPGLRAGRTPPHRKIFTLFLLAVFRHAGPIRVDLDIAPGVLDVLPSPGIALLKGFHPRVVGGRSGVGRLDQRRRAKQDAEGESGNERLHDISPC
jgi:hypothetical protein